MRKRLLICFLVVLIIISMFSVVSAGPYGYGDSADLDYKITEGKIYYRYGNSTAYVTSLRPKNLNWSEWRVRGVDIISLSAGKYDSDCSINNVDVEIEDAVSQGVEVIEVIV